MNAKTLKALYEAYGIKNNQLRSVEDLKRIHRLEPEKIKGFLSLNELNKKIFIKFLLDFYNGSPLDERITLLPKRVYYTIEENKPPFIFFGYIGCRKLQQIHIETPLA